MAPSAGAILLAAALLTANAAWCESDSPLAPVPIASSKEGYKPQLVLVRETEVGMLVCFSSGCSDGTHPRTLQQHLAELRLQD